jgi:spoIIIJ-associated protein
MEWVETTGRTVELALDLALDQLGIDESEAQFEVLEEPRSGLFGRKDARLRARVKPLSREKPAPERRRRERKPASKSSGGAKKSSTSNAKSATKAALSKETSRPVKKTSAAKSQSDRRERTGEMTITVDEQAEQAAVFTRGLLSAFSLSADVAIRKEGDDVVIIDVVGDDLGLLVGPKGVTLKAIEDLVRSSVQRRTEGFGARIHVDVGGYREKRRVALSDFAREVAAKVQESGDEYALEPMAAADRKVVHDAIAEIDGLETLSDGEEPRRRVVIRSA